MEEVKTALQRLKNKKSPGIYSVPSELRKYGG
jgi:hypothetical protein